MLNGPRVAMTVSDRAVVKASGERLLRDFANAAKLVRSAEWFYNEADRRAGVLEIASITRSRTQYAAILTAFGL